MPRKINRRDFVSAASLLGAGLMASQGWPAKARANSQPALHKPRFANERIGFGGIGLRYQGSVDLHTANSFGDIVAVCDVDKNVRDQAKASFGSRPQSFEDYRELLKRKDVDAVIIATPDHWHVKIAADALRAGKSVYVEKPLTLTVDEGKFLRKIIEQTGGVLQVGSWQRSDSRFRLAVEMVRAGRIGTLKKVDVVLGKNKAGGPFDQRPTPRHLNWNLWQGQTPARPYVEERCHYTFRWWLEYSGGQMTDWGCHHVDIAQWAINSFPIKVEATGKFPQSSDRSYNVPVDFAATYEFANGVAMTVADTGRNGILFTGDKGRLFVNRGTISGKPVEELKRNPFDRDQFKLYEFDNHDRQQRAGKLDSIVNHMGNFVDCMESRKTPISDFESQHRSATTCHLANLSLRLGRSLRWNAEQELFVDDKQANALLAREQRKGFEVA